MRGAGVSKMVASALFGALSLAVLLAGSKPATAQDGKGVAKCIGCSVDGKTTPRTVDGHPDLTGYWGGINQLFTEFEKSPGGFKGGTLQRTSDGSVLYDPSTEYNSETGAGRLCQGADSDACQLPNQPPYTPDYMRRVKKIAATEYGGTTPLDPVEACRPQGVPRAAFAFGTMIMQSPQIIALLLEAAPYSTYRIVYMDGRAHQNPKDYESTYWGDSIGHWEGDTLVIDTVGFNDDTWVGGDVVGHAKYTSIHSAKMHVVERITRDGDVLTISTTVEDPIAFTRPWVLAPQRVHIAPATDIMSENICTPNNKDHLIKPSPEDRDIQQKCGYRCEPDNSRKSKQ
jgi:hypothetical protein